MKIYAAYNIKGGVGKTASAVNLAYLAARDGGRSLLWDLDPQGAATWYLRVKPRVKGGGKKLIRGKTELDAVIKGTDFEGLDLLPADFSYRKLDLHLAETKKPEKRMRRLLEPLAEEYDSVFLDCPPSISLATEAVFRAADALLVPSIPTPLSLRTLVQLRWHLKKHELEPALLPFFCMVDRRKALHRQICEEEAGRFLRSHIPYSSLVEQMGTHRAPLGAFARTSPPALAYEALWREVLARQAENR